VFAAWCGIGQIDKIAKWVWSKAAMGLAAAWLVFALLIVMTWHVQALEALIPKWMIKAIYPIDKTDLDMLRFTHFLALALWVTHFVSRRWKVLHTAWLRPVILCGQHSLPIFCLGVFLSFSAHWILTQYTKGVWEQLAVSLLGIVIMIGAAWLLDRAERVPNLFVKVTEVEEPETAVEITPAAAATVAPVSR
jgi:hypothetical protein